MTSRDLFRSRALARGRPFYPRGADRGEYGAHRRASRRRRAHRRPGRGRRLRRAVDGLSGVEVSLGGRLFGAGPRPGNVRPADRRRDRGSVPRRPTPEAAELASGSRWPGEQEAVERPLVVRGWSPRAARGARPVVGRWVGRGPRYAVADDPRGLPRRSQVATVLTTGRRRARRRDLALPRVRRDQLLAVQMTTASAGVRVEGG